MSALAFDEARRRLLEEVRRVASERVGVRHAAGRVLAEDLVAAFPLPAFDHSAMDGYALATADLADGMKDSYDVRCDPGQVALGGGFRGDFSHSDETNVGSSRPIRAADSGAAPGDGEGFVGWRVTVLNPAGGVAAVRPEVWVICAG